MAGNFWKSSHFTQWLLDPQEVMIHRFKDLQLYNIKEDEYYKLMIFFANFTQTMGEALKLRQQVIATAIVYFKRFYSKYSLKCIDPFLLIPTCLLLATKVEETGLHQQQRYVQIPAQILKQKYPHLYPQDYPYKINSVWECEFYLLEIMDCCLITYHPYRSLIQYANDLSPDDTQLLQTAWRIVNDSYKTDVCLLYPPSLIALACLQMACVVLKKENSKQWFADLNVDMEKICEITRHILNLYDLWKTYDDKEQLKEIYNKIPKPRVQTVEQQQHQQQQQQQQSQSQQQSLNAHLQSQQQQQQQQAQTNSYKNVTMGKVRYA